MYAKVKAYANYYNGTVLKVNRTRAIVIFRLRDRRERTLTVPIVRTQEEFQRAGYACVLIPETQVPDAAARA